MSLRAATICICVSGAVACSETIDGPPDSPTAPQAGPVITVPSEIASWLRENAVPFTTAQPGSEYSDLLPLADMVGNARVVALGEATHGTREFFQMKHRVLEFLVKELDFDLFAIEATWPETNRLNEFVHTGIGDPVELLSGLYFWTWNTQEVLDMILWMREHNQDPGSSPTVSFYGFDMQFPGMAIHNVLVFLRAVDTDAAAFAESKYNCMRPFANSMRGFVGVSQRYGDQSTTTKNNCRADLAEVYDSLFSKQSAYAAASTPEDISKALQSARLVLQFEDMSSNRTAGARDLDMAENAVWLLDEAGLDSKIVLWAHNGHVADNPTYGGGGSMGSHLRHEYGNDLVIVGFDFYRGSFQAVGKNVVGSYTGLDIFTVGVAPQLSYEWYFHSAGYPRLILDVRDVDLETSATSWLAGPREMRSIGAVFTPSNPSIYLYDVSIPTRYDLIIYFDETSGAMGLPFQYPTSW